LDGSISGGAVEAHGYATHCIDKAPKAVKVYFDKVLEAYTKVFFHRFDQTRRSGLRRGI
jgi:hypothetical protein